MVVKHIA